MEQISPHKLKCYKLHTRGPTCHGIILDPYKLKMKRMRIEQATRYFQAHVSDLVPRLICIRSRKNSQKVQKIQKIDKKFKKSQKNPFFVRAR
jgi:hypothetical protein